MGRHVRASWTYLRAPWRSGCTNIERFALVWPTTPHVYTPLHSHSRSHCSHTTTVQSSSLHTTTLLPTHTTSSHGLGLQHYPTGVLCHRSLPHPYSSLLRALLSCLSAVQPLEGQKEGRRQQHVSALRSTLHDINCYATHCCNTRITFTCRLPTPHLPPLQHARISIQSMASRCGAKLPAALHCPSRRSIPAAHWILSLRWASPPGV